MTRDYFFEFAGMPKSGKTTICDVVVHFLKRCGLKVSEYHGGGRYAPIDKSSLPSLNLLLAVNAVEFVVKNLEREKIKHRIFMMDRGLFDRRVFTRTLLELNKIDAAEAAVISDFLELPRLINRIDGVFVFLTQPELSLTREYKNKLVEGPGRVMNEKFLWALRDATERECDAWQKSAKHIRVIDTSIEDGNIVGCSRIVADDISRIVGLGS